MSRGRIVHWMLEEIATPYSVEWLIWGANGSRSADYLRINPMGKVPAIVHNDNIVTEAAAICLYLAEAFPSTHLSPTPKERADYYRWTLFAAGPLEQPVMCRTMNWEAPAERRGMLGFGAFNKTISTLTELFKSRTYACGNRFAAADVYIGSSISWGLQFGTIPPNVDLQRYVDHLRTRDAYKRAEEINNKQAKEIK
jgi:glutathione S-transferase